MKLLHNGESLKKFFDSLPAIQWKTRAGVLDQIGMVGSYDDLVIVTTYNTHAFRRNLPIMIYPYLGGPPRGLFTPLLIGRDFLWSWNAPAGITPGDYAVQPWPETLDLGSDVSLSREPA